MNPGDLQSSDPASAPADATFPASEERWRQLANSLPQLVWTCTPAGACDFLSQPWVDFTGIPEATQLGTGWLEQVHPDDRETLMQAWSAAVRAKMSFQVEFRIRRHDGVYRNFDTRALPSCDRAGRVLQWVGSNTDITERKQNEETLRQLNHELESRVAERTAALRDVVASLELGIAERKQAEAVLQQTKTEAERHLALLETGFDTLSEGVIISDLAGNAISQNRSAVAMHGCASPREFPRQQREFHEQFELVGADGRIIPFAHWPRARILRGEVLRDLEIQIRRKEGGWERWFSYSGSLAHDKDGRPIFAVLSFVDVSERRKTEAALRASEARLRAVIDAEPECVKLLAADGTVLDMNPAGLRMVEAESLADMRGQCVYPFVVAEDRAAFVGLVERVLGGESAVLEFQITGLKGTRRWLETHASPLRDADGKVTAVLGVSRDTTERKRAEASLKLFRSLVDRVKDAIEVIDPVTGRFLDLNEKGCQDLGYSRAELLSKAVWDINPIVDARTFAEHMAATRAAGSLTFQSIHQRKDGTTFPVEISLTYIQNERDYLVGVVRDTTERLAAEDAIRRLAAFPELNPNPVLAFAADGALTYHNRAAAALVQSLGAPDLTSVLPAGTRALIDTCLATAQPQLRVETLHGPRTLSWSFYPLTEINAVHCYVGEITERLRMEEQLRQSQKMDAIGQLAGGVAHDFNNILAMILLQAELTGETPHLPPDAVEGLGQIRAAAERAANLTRQLLLFSRRQVMQARDLDLNESVTNLARMLQRIIGEDVRLQLHLHSGVLPTRADAGMLDQVLMNLAVNARDAMPAGGQLRIETQVQIVDEDLARLHADATPGNYVCVSVSDTGCGIQPDVLPRIFEPFFTTKEAGRGTGLGLAIVFGIVKQHRGWITVTTELGRGSTFQIFLPSSLRELSGASAAVARTAPRGGSETILLAEDEPTVRMLTRIILERRGYRVLEAANGPEAVVLWTRHRDEIALLLTDLVMPGGMTGLQLAQRLRHDQPRLKIIMTSGYSAEIAGTELEPRHGDIFLQKPCAPELLLETVRQCLDRRE